MEIKLILNEGVLRIQLNRPERKNVLTHAMYTVLADALQNAVHNPAVKVVLIQGHEHCFCAGNDLSDFEKNEVDLIASPVFRFLRMISTFPKPIVAQVQGMAVGIGTTLLLHCDLVYADTQAKFSMPFVKLGLCPEAASSLLLPRLAGYQRAAQLLLLGDMFDVNKAYECGIVSEVLEPACLDAHVALQLNKLLALPLPSLQATKQLMKGDVQVLIAQVMEQEASQFVSLLQQPAAKEALLAFAEKRAPNFK